MMAAPTTGRLKVRESARAKECFFIWYHQDRNRHNTAKIAKLRESQVAYYTRVYQWHARADALDLEAERKAQAQAVEVKAAMLVRHRNLGQLLTMRAGEYFAAVPLDNARDAIQAARVGVELERTAEGLPHWVSSIVEADDETLRRRYEELQQQLNATRISSGSTGTGPPGAAIEGSVVNPDEGGD